MGCAEKGDAGDSNMRACRKYAALNESCEGYTTAENFQTCNPFIHMCYKPQSCMIPDQPGICVDESMAFKVGDCCQNDRDCDSGICAEGMDEMGISRQLCQSQDKPEPDTSVESSILDESFCITEMSRYQDGEVIDLGSVCIDDISFTTQ